MVQSERWNQVASFLSYLCFSLSVLFLPWFFDQRLADSYIIPKQYVLIGLTLLMAIFFLLRALLNKTIAWQRTIFDWALIGWLAVAFLSAIFSSGRAMSFLGRSDIFIINFVFLFFLGLYYWFTLHQISSVKHWLVAWELFKFSTAIVGLVFVLKTVLKWDILQAWMGFAGGAVDRINSPLGLLMVVLFLLSAGMLIKKEISLGKIIINLVYAVLALAVLVLLSFQALWWMLLAALALLLLLGFGSLKEVRLGWLTVLFATLVTVMVFLIFGTPKILQAPVPSELGLGRAPSWQIAKDTIFSNTKNFIFGSGLGTFGYDFSRFRPDSFNYEQLAWSLRFNVPGSSVIAILSEGGTLFLAVLVFVFLFVLGHMLSVWRKTRGGATIFGIRERNSIYFEAFLTTAAWVLLTVGMFWFFYGPVLWWAWWLLLALSIVGVSFSGGKFIKNGLWKVGEQPQYSLSFSFVLVVLLMLAVLIGIWGARVYGAELNFARALKEQDLAKAEEKVLQAIAWRGDYESYYVSLSQIELRLAQVESQRKDGNVSKVAELVGRAVSSGKKATELSPSSVGAWENLAVIYNNAAALAPDSRDWAIKSLEEAIRLEPNNPILYWYLGNNFGLQNKWDEAKKNFEKAVAFKNDYAQGYVGLANVYEQTKDLDKAVETYAQILSWAGSNPEVLFNYGRLLYNRNHSGDRALAEKVWLEGARVSPNYSNTLYSLGLLYESKGDTVSALRYYNQVKELNPDNQDVALKVERLLGQSKK